MKMIRQDIENTGRYYSSPFYSKRQYLAYRQQN